MTNAKMNNSKYNLFQTYKVGIIAHLVYCSRLSGAFCVIAVQVNQFVTSSRAIPPKENSPKYSTSTQVAHLGREYFSQYMFNSFSFTLEKELANSLSSEGRFQNSNDIQGFKQKLKQYCWDVSKIVEDFSGGWYGKQSFEGNIANKKKTKDFTSYAMTKLLSEVQQKHIMVRRNVLFNNPNFFPEPL